MVGTLEDHDPKHAQRSSAIALTNGLCPLLELVCGLPQKALRDAEIFPSKIWLRSSREDVNELVYSFALRRWDVAAFEHSVPGLGVIISVHSLVCRLQNK